jgi:hypothetical protein
MGQKLHGIYQVLTYVDAVNLLGDNLDKIKKTTSIVTSANAGSKHRESFVCKGWAKIHPALALRIPVSFVLQRKLSICCCLGTKIKGKIII